MARKNLIEFTEQSSAGELSADNRPMPGERPLAGTPSARAPLAIGGISKSLQNITSKVERAEAVERQLAEGQTIIDLDTDAVDGSIVVDRLELSDADQQALMEQIREHGQQVPILVRPHPTSAGRFQVAYGHRRLAAARSLGIKVRAVVRALTDDQLVVSQGQENNARANLSYIERANFAHRLEARGFGRAVIMAALGVDKAALSKMIAVADRISGPLIEAIGPAPSLGRRRWEELAELLSDKGRAKQAAALVDQPAFRQLPSDGRFQALLRHVSQAKASRAQPEVWSTDEGARAVTMRTTERTLQLTFDNKAAPAFGDFVRGQLEALYKQFKQENGDR